MSSYGTIRSVLLEIEEKRVPHKGWKNIYPKNRGYVSTDEAVTVASDLGLRMRDDEIEQLRRGMIVELEHGKYSKCPRCQTSINVTGDELHLTGMIAMAHLSEMSGYYVKLEKMEENET